MCVVSGRLATAAVNNDSILFFVHNFTLLFKLCGCLCVKQATWQLSGLQNSKTSKLHQNMKFASVLLVAFIGCIGFLPNNIQAQSDPEAKKILDKVSQKYKSLASVEGDFVLTITGDKTTDTQNGKVYIKGDKYKFTAQELERISDGKTVWTHLKPQKEVQVNAVDKNEISPNQLFTLYTKGYTYSLNTEVKRTANQMVVDLSPTDKKSNYFKVRLFIDKTTNMIAKATLFEKSGMRYTYELKNIKTNTLKNNSLFAFNAAKYPGVEVIDLR